MIKKRKIFYLSGFDPRGFRFYREIIKESCKSYQKLSHEEITIEQQKNKVFLKNITKKTYNEYEFLSWDELIRENWIRNPFTLFIETLKAYKNYAKNILWRKAIFLPSGPLITLFFPISTLLVLSILLSGLSFFIAGIFTNILALKLLIIPLTIIPTAIILDQIKSLWLLRFFIFNVKAFHTNPKLLNPYIEKFSVLLAQAVNNEEYDEIQLIAHSNGTILLFPLLEKALPHIENINKLKILSLGQCIPLASYYTKATKFHKSMERVKSYPLLWQDLSAPSDGVCFALHNVFKPFDGDEKTIMTLKSPQFHKYYPKEIYQKLYRNKFELHFSYLSTSPLLSPYNIIHLMTDNQPLEEHFISKEH